MLSGKLVHLIEAHWDQIMASAIDQVRREPGLAHIRTHYPLDSEDWPQVLLQNLGQWLLAGPNSEIAKKYEELGKFRFAEGVPLHESVQASFILREKILDFVQDHLMDKNTLALYAEEELDRRVGRFFDILTVHMVRGYEAALRESLRQATLAAG